MHKSYTNNSTQNQTKLTFQTTSCLSTPQSIASTPPAPATVEIKTTVTHEYGHISNNHSLIHVRTPRDYSNTRSDDAGYSAIPGWSWYLTGNRAPRGWGLRTCIWYEILCKNEHTKQMVHKINVHSLGLCCELVFRLSTYVRSYIII